jgi:hypothetical protein
VSYRPSFLNMPFINFVGDETQTLILGLAGPARSGKDTVASIVAGIIEDEGHSVKRDAFANKLKVSAANALGFKFDTIEEYRHWSDDFKNWGEIIVYDTRTSPERKEISGREYLQLYGTEAHREVFSTDFWVDALLSVPVEEQLLIVTDVRFPNEAEAIIESGGEVWRVNREGSGVPGNHVSETPLPDDLVDHEIDNNGTLEDLRKLIKETLHG